MALSVYAIMQREEEQNLEKSSNFSMSILISRWRKCSEIFIIIFIASRFMASLSVNVIMQSEGRQKYIYIYFFLKIHIFSMPILISKMAKIF